MKTYLLKTGAEQTHSLAAYQDGLIQIHPNSANCPPVQRRRRIEVLSSSPQDQRLRFFRQQRGPLSTSRHIGPREGEPPRPQKRPDEFGQQVLGVQEGEGVRLEGGQVAPERVPLGVGGVGAGGPGEQPAEELFHTGRVGVAGQEEAEGARHLQKGREGVNIFKACIIGLVAAADQKEAQGVAHLHTDKDGVSILNPGAKYGLAPG
jgi:hypothetical protein